MATSSITKNFVVSGQRQVEKFANAIEEFDQETLYRAPTPDLRITHLRGSEIKKFMAKVYGWWNGDFSIYNSRIFKYSIDFSFQMPHNIPVDW